MLNAGLKDAVSRIVHRTATPAQYMGGELNAVTKDHRTVRGKLCLAFPDTYSLGMSHHGLQVLYSLMNADPRWACERAFTPWVDFEQLLRDRETLDSVTRAVHDLTDFEPVLEPRTIGELARRLDVTPATLRAWEEAGILAPAREPTGYRTFRAEDVRDAELAHLLRRGGYPLARIALVVQQIRVAGGTETLSAALTDWRHRLTAQGLAMLAASARLNDYLSVRAQAP